MRKIVVTATLLAFLGTWPAWAGSDHKADMEAMKAEFSKCLMCKNWIPIIDTVMPVMQTEFVTLDNGMAMVHTVSDPAKVKLLHEANAKMGESAKACMALSDADAPKQLCMLCQDIRSVAKAGAQVSHGSTKTGDMLVIASADPKVQAQISTLKAKCASMMASEHSSH